MSEAFDVRGLHLSLIFTFCFRTRLVLVVLVGSLDSEFLERLVLARDWLRL